MLCICLIPLDVYITSTHVPLPTPILTLPEDLSWLGRAQDLLQQRQDPVPRYLQILSILTCPTELYVAVLFMSFVFLPQTANQIRQRQNRPGVDGLGMSPVRTIRSREISTSGSGTGTAECSARVYGC